MFDKVVARTVFGQTGSDSWMHIRITWKAFKYSDAWIPILILLEQVTAWTSKFL